ncbi:DUF3616 domain-containing protein [Bradyrhizobium septentrionale]|uniref:DUF3616 domain-containing protein n=1 Tax=Bradyrhizobium septentrionale TaxID=1404411 RepID=A0A973W828_9BRAD|nr:DUF3616 domain-containing protein [Bradyrhizobium septentrionale]UGY17972.1 DUF3616 domain-containing protein [Bradyrhizobium septentrionale]
MPVRLSLLFKEPSIVLPVALLLVLFVQAPAAARHVWPVHGTLEGKNGKRSKDVSGIACTAQQGFPRCCLVIDDNLQAAQFVEVNDGEIQVGDMMSLIDDRFKGEPLELDGEGVAYADGFFYVIGSHGHPRDREHELGKREIAARIRASSQVVRFRTDGKKATSPVERTSRLREIIMSQPELEAYRDRRLEENGLTIEGIVIRNGRLFAGFRGPSFNAGRAAVLSVSVDGLFGEAPPDARLWKIPLGDGTGIRDLAAFQSGILVLAGPTSSERGTYSIYWWDGESENVRLLKELSGIVGKNGKRKAEALLPLEERAAGLRILLLFDGKKEGAGRSQCANP